MNNNDLPHAADARRTVEQGLYQNTQSQLSTVVQSIKKAIEQGSLSISGDGYILPSVVNILQIKGYKVTNNSFRNEECWSVSW